MSRPNKACGDKKLGTTLSRVLTNTLSTQTVITTGAQTSSPVMKYVLKARMMWRVRRLKARCYPSLSPKN
jgi:hypothetical protein